MPLISAYLCIHRTGSLLDGQARTLQQFEEGGGGGVGGSKRDFWKGGVEGV